MTAVAGGAGMVAAGVLLLTEHLVLSEHLVLTEHLDAWTDAVLRRRGI